MNCKSCQSVIPEKRSQLGYTTCTQCSTTESYGFVNIINHKTGNTIQVMPKEIAAAINKVGDRKRFGTILRGGSKSTSYNPKKLSQRSCSTAYIGTKETYEKVGRESMNILEHSGLQAALRYVQKELDDCMLNKMQASSITRVLQAFIANNN